MKPRKPVSQTPTHMNVRRKLAIVFLWYANIKSLVLTQRTYREPCLPDAFLYLRPIDILAHEECCKDCGDEDPHQEPAATEGSDQGSDAARARVYATLHRLVCFDSDRFVYFSTLFLRNLSTTEVLKHECLNQCCFCFQCSLILGIAPRAILSTHWRIPGSCLAPWLCQGRRYR